jgi:hypothetical protein
MHAQGGKEHSKLPWTSVNGREEAKEQADEKNLAANEEDDCLE